MFGDMFWLFCVFLVCLLIQPSTSQINLATNKPARQSSIYDTAYATVAVDNCIDQEIFCGNCVTIFCCSHQAIEQNYVWWTVNLQQPSEISSIFVYFRLYPQNYLYPYEIFRTQGYTIRLSEDPDPQSGQICYVDTAYDLANETRTRNHTTCSNLTGTYVHFTNNGSTFNINPSTGRSNALLELCEVQVFGCPVKKYGTFCDKNCSSLCLDGRCSPASGHCLACSDKMFLTPNGTCQYCPEPCTSCKDYIGCESCPEDYYIINTGTENICNRCSENCLLCQSLTGCGNCSSNFYLQSENHCAKCPEHCTQCLNYEGCAICETGYFNNEGNCSICHDGCTECNASSCFACHQGYYGELCNIRCGFCKIPTCNQTTGFCTINDCVEGYEGEQCLTRTTNQGSQQTYSHYYGGAVGGIVLIIIVGIAVSVLYKKRLRTKTKDDHVFIINRNTQVSKKNHAYGNMTLDTNETTAEDTYYNITPMGTPISTFKNMVEVELKTKATTLKDEFKTFTKSAEHPCVIAKQQKNKEKNRFKNIFAYDHSRVVLAGEKENDYINANYIDSVDESKVYIAAQGPKQQTVDDFWKMIWQENCGKIVMLTNLREGIKIKCEKYWPEERNEKETLHFNIKLLKEKKYGFYTIRYIEMLNRETLMHKQIQQFHFHSWPDYGTPIALELVLFHRRVNSFQSTLNGPLCVHCSAGVGRTGTYIGLDALLNFAMKTGYIDIVAFLKKMRKDRMLMIQTEDQYVALHEILLEALNMDNSLYSKSVFYSLQKKSNYSQDLLEEFKKFQMSKPACDDNKALEEKLSSCGREDEIVKDNLLSDVDNKTFVVPSYNSRSGFIVTQYPTYASLKEFWTMVIEKGCRTIVVLAEEHELGAINDIFLNIQHHQVEDILIHVIEKCGETIDLQLSNKKMQLTHEMQILCSTYWNTKLPQPGMTKEILKLAEKVDSREYDSRFESPIVIMSSNGSKAGLFCLVYNTRKQILMDEEVDILQAARQLQLLRKTFIDSYEEYEYCYNALQEYLNTTDEYMNL